MKLTSRQALGYDGANNIAAITIAGLVITLEIVFYFTESLTNKLDGKGVYATIQATELDKRKQKFETPVFVTASDGLKMVAIESGNPKFPYVWIATDQASSIEPDGIFRVGGVISPKTSCASISRVVANQKLPDEVTRYLNSHCAN